MDLYNAKSELNTRALSKVAAIPHLSWLNKLPIEILEMIRSLSADALLWRYISVLGLCDQVLETESRDLEQQQINQICFWERGTRPRLMSHRATSRVLRLSIDSRGIQSIECATDCPYAKSRSGCFAFIVEDESHLQDVVGEFKVI